MTREEKIEKVAKILRDFQGKLMPYPGWNIIAKDIIDALTEPELGMYGRAEDGDEVWYGELTGIEPEAVFPFYVGNIGSKYFTPIPGLREFLEEAEG